MTSAVETSSHAVSPVLISVIAPSFRGKTLGRACFRQVSRPLIVDAPRQLTIGRVSGPIRSRIFQTRLMARLIFGTPQGERAIELQLVNGLGRHPANTLQLMDKIASKEHAVVELRGSS